MHRSVSTRIAQHQQTPHVASGPLRARTIRPRVHTLVPLVVGLVVQAAFGVQVRVETIDGVQVDGQLLRLTPAVAVRDSRSTLHEFLWSDIYQITLPEMRPLTSIPEASSEVATERSAAESRVTLNLTDGSELRGMIAGAEDGLISLQRRVTVRHEAAGAAPPDNDEVASAQSTDRRVRIPIKMLRSIIATDLDATTQARVTEVQQEASAATDVAIVRRGARTLVLRGSATTINPSGVAFRWNDRDLNLRWTQLAALFFARQVVERDPLSVFTHAGERLFGRVDTASEASLTLRSTTLGRLGVDLSEIRAIRASSDRIVALSELEPTRFVGETLLGEPARFHIDQSPLQQPLRIANVRYARGLVLRSASSISFDLDRGYRACVAQVGIIEPFESTGSARVRALVDNVLRWEQDVSGETGAKLLRVDLTDAKVLTLEVDFGENLDLGDFVGFGSARLVRP